MQSPRYLRTAVRAGGVCAAATAAIVLAAGPAAAHVTANTTNATQGGYAKIAFRVPTEDPTAGTIKLQVTLPTDHPVASVSTKPIPGWKSEVTIVTLDKPVRETNATVTKAVKTITWTADSGTRIAPGEFQEFEVLAGPLPNDTNQLIMPSVQTYDNGKVVDWTDQPAAAGQPEPEHPAPALSLVAAGTGDSHMGAMAEGSAAGSTSDGSDNTARWLGGVGLGIGALALGFGVGGLLRTRSTASPAGKETE